MKGLSLLDTEFDEDYKPGKKKQKQKRGPRMKNEGGGNEHFFIKEEIDNDMKVDTKEENENNTKDESGPFDCSICFKQFALKKYVRRHIQVVHDKKKSFKCLDCDKTFSFNSKLKAHHNAVHGGAKPFQCPVCEKGFSQKASMKRHIEDIHEGKKPFQCPTCRYKSADENDLNEHIATKHDGGNTRFFKKEYSLAHLASIELNQEN